MKVILIRILLALSLSLGVLVYVFNNIFLGKVPFPADLLVSTYNPWAKEKMAGWEQGVPFKPVGQDELRIFYPSRTFTNQSITEDRQVPFWNPYIFSGNYFVGQSETAVFYPLSLIFFLLPQIPSWTVLILLEPVITGLGMYLFVRKVGLPVTTALFSALGWAYCGVVIVRMAEGLSMGQTLIWIPWALFGLEGYLKSGKSKDLLVAVTAYGFVILAGWFQYAFITIVFSLTYALFWTGRKGQPFHHFVFRAIAPIVFAVGLTLFQTVPALSAFFDSPRGTTDATGSLVELMPKISHLFTLVSPDFFGNPVTFNYRGTGGYTNTMVWVALPTLIFAVFSLGLIKNQKLVRFFWLAIVTSLLIGIDNPVSRFLIAAKIPFFSTFILSRFLMVASFSLCTLSALGMDNFLKQKPQQIRRLIFISGLMFLTSILLFTFSQTGSLPVKSLLIPAGIALAISGIFTFLFLAMKKCVVRPEGVKAAVAVVFFFFLFVQQAIFLLKYLPASEKIFVFPDHQVFEWLRGNAGYHRVASLADSHIDSNLWLQWGIYSPEGVAAMYPSRYAELVSYAKSRGECLGCFDRIDVSLPVSREAVSGQSQDHYLLRLLALTGTRYLVGFQGEGGKTTVSALLKEAYSEKGWQIYEITNSLPRFFLTGDYEVASEKNQILAQIFSETVSSKKIILEKPPGFVSGVPIIGSAEIISYKPNAVEFAVNTKSPSLLYLSDNYSSSFEAFLDNKPADLLRANYSFRAVMVPAGSHRLVIRYKFRPIYWGIGISLGTLGVMLLLLRNRGRVLTDKSPAEISG
jgi:hypothetical protein